MEARLDSRYRRLITCGRSCHAPLVDFCNQYDPQARAAGSEKPCFLRAKPRSCAGKIRCEPLARRRSRDASGLGSRGVGKTRDSPAASNAIARAGRSTPARLGSDTSCRETLIPRGVEPSRGFELPPCRAELSLARRARLPGRGAFQRPPRREPMVGRTRGAFGRRASSKGWADSRPPLLERRIGQALVQSPPDSLAWTMRVGG